MRLNGGPLAYASRRQPHPLTLDEEAALAFAACGVTGYALAELPYDTGDLQEADAGNIMTHLVARTCASGDGMHTVAVFVINDAGAWMLRRPQDFPRGEIAELAGAARAHELTRLYERSRVRISEARVDVPRTVPFVPTFNKWWVNLPGTTYFVCVNECSALYINILLTAFSDEFAFFVLDERNRFRPAGIDRFGRSRGGHLRDDPEAHRSRPSARSRRGCTSSRPSNRAGSSRIWG